MEVSVTTFQREVFLYMNKQKYLILFKRKKSFEVQLNCGNDKVYQKATVQNLKSHLNLREIV